jgi:hypothetical protein
MQGVRMVGAGGCVGGAHTPTHRIKGTALIVN